MYKDEVKTILEKELKKPLTVSEIKIILLRNNCNISKPQLFNILIDLAKDCFLIRETSRYYHPKKKPIYLFYLNKN